ncbi:type II toxin-antitoxin system ParD family antitoxin [Sphingomonas cavernae]|uniref:Type II toxin-antitoxin system ParD family antitoxin n=1 Tax=Sphingomonas cavernae TaxID=2320861 RepID=A0A418WKV0_9SPHN|nr:type II toxin-antitoxin system ParD family antitoxin [Sphingomonas cavernae]RJF90653.1 hypothetical protein D3876_10580 [Sphingomonas cavernae]
MDKERDAQALVLKDARRLRHAARDDFEFDREQTNARVSEVRLALNEGEESGEPEPFDFTAFRQRKAEQYR